MAHNIEYNKQRGSHSFVSKKEIAWHKLGTVVDDAMTSKEAIQLANLDFTVIKVPTYAKFPLDHITDNKVVDISGQVFDKTTVPGESRGKIVPNRFATVRTDTKAVLGGVGSRYEVIQNQEAFDFIDSIIGENNAKYETAGVLGNGETTFVTAKLPNYIRIEGSDDIIEDYILFSNNHAGEGEIVAMITPIRVVCNNTLSMAINRCKNKVSFRHTKNVRNKLDNAMTVMKLHNIYTKDLNEILNEASKNQVVEAMEKQYVNSVFLTPDEIQLVEKNNGNLLGVEEISTRKKNQIVDVKTYMERGFGQDMHKGTLLWLFNGVNGYLSNYKNYKDDEKRFTSIIDGESNKINQKAFDKMLLNL